MKRNMQTDGMNLVLILLILINISSSYSTDTDSYEINRIGLTPLHDAIIFSDIADIMHEFENMNSQLSTHVFSESDSEEDVESLLSEYQHYLDKAHKQNINYIEKNKGKNKVPLFRRDKFTKFNPTRLNNYNDKLYAIAKTNPLSIVSHLNTLIPQVSDMLQNNSGESMLGTKSFLLNLPSLWPKSTITKSIDSSCYCKENQIPCRCACKQCLIELSPSSSQFKRGGKIQKSMDETLSDFEHGIEQSKNNAVSNNLNIILKIILQFHNTSNVNDLPKSEDHADVPREFISKTDFPLSYAKFPTILELAKYRNNIMNYNHPSPLHKITIHKRKKSRVNNSNKKHKSKKVDSSRIFKDDSDMQVKDSEKSYVTDSLYTDLTINNKDTTQDKLPINVTQSSINLNFWHNNITTEAFRRNIVFSFDSNIFKNISKQGNGSNDIQKIDNSIETDSEKFMNMTTMGTIRLKRDLPVNAVTLVAHITNTISRVNESHVKNATKQLQKFDKMSDSDLLFWPIGNKSNSSEKLARNMTEIILDKVTKRTKMNLTSDMIRANRTAALERAIFGNVDWNDTDEVVPIFMSFVGKYMRGALTFCSGKICHSIKCVNKVCIQRICSPEHRYNKNGHCLGNETNENETTMLSAMDLPSNVTFEVVDILQNRMLGKLYGKISLCINAKCSTFAASKKLFYKLNCTSKTLNATGHCPNKTKAKYV